MGKRIQAMTGAAGLLLLLLAGCTRRDLDTRPEQGHLKIILNWDTAEQGHPSGYYFYPQDGGTMFYRPGDQNGYEGAVDAGTYHVIMVSTDRSGAALAMSGDYRTDRLHALPAPARAAGEYILNVEKVYSISTENIVIPRSHVPVVVHLRPVNLASRILLAVDPMEIEEIESLSITVGGIVYSVTLHDRKPGEATSAVASDLVFNPENGMHEGIISVLGILRPNEVTIRVTYKDRKTESAEPVDISDILEELEEGESAEIELVLPRNEAVGLVVSVLDWENGTGWGEAR